MTLPKVGTPIHVLWMDSTSLPGWNYVPEKRPVDFAPRTIETYGRLVGENPVSILVAGSFSKPLSEGGDWGYLDPLVIPRGCIVTLKAV